jgi:hypothetical protein
MLVLGVDIGARGALALVDAETGELIEIHDMPVLADGPKGRAATRVKLLARRVLEAIVGRVVRHHAHRSMATYLATSRIGGEGRERKQGRKCDSDDGGFHGVIFLLVASCSH